MAKTCQMKWENPTNTTRKINTTKPNMKNTKTKLWIKYINLMCNRQSTTIWYSYATGEHELGIQCGSTFAKRCVVSNAMLCFRFFFFHFVPKQLQIPLWLLVWIETLDFYCLKYIACTVCTAWVDINECTF